MITSSPESRPSAPPPAPGFTLRPIADPVVQRGAVQALMTESLTDEHGFLPLAIEGTLPQGLRGTLARVGPMGLDLFGRRYAHAFEGDGGVMAMRFTDGQAHAAVRLTASAGLQAERAAGRMLYGSNVPWPTRLTNGLRQRFKNTANTSPLWWQGKLYALMEAGQPTELALDADDLRTVGSTSWDGVVPAAFSAHPHRVDALATTFNFGVEYGRVPQLAVFALPDHGPARCLTRLPLPFSPMLHDFIATDRHLVWLVSPIALSVPRMLLGLGDFSTMFRWQPERGVEVIVMSLADPSQVTRFTVEAFHQWHFANAFSPSGHEVVLDYARYPDFRSFQSISGDPAQAAAPSGTLHRAHLDVRAKTLRASPVVELPMEFPRVHPRVEGAVAALTYGVAGHQGEALAVIDNARARVRDGWQFASHEVPTEPIVVPRSDREDDAWLLSLVYDHRRGASHVAVFDAAHLSAGPLAQVMLRQRIPLTYHGTWIPG